MRADVPQRLRFAVGDASHFIPVRACHFSPGERRCPHRRVDLVRIDHWCRQQGVDCERPRPPGVPCADERTDSYLMLTGGGTTIEPVRTSARAVWLIRRLRRFVVDSKLVTHCARNGHRGDVIPAHSDAIARRFHSFEHGNSRAAIGRSGTAACCLPSDLQKGNAPAQWRSAVLQSVCSGPQRRVGEPAVNDQVRSSCLIGIPLQRRAGRARDLYGLRPRFRPHL